MRHIRDKGKVPTFNLWKSRNGTEPETNDPNAGNHVIDEGNLGNFDIAADDEESMNILTTSPTARPHMNQSISNRGQKTTNNSVIEWLFPNGSNSNELQEDSDNDVSEQDQQDIPYDYKPFFGNKLVNQTKIDILKETELAEHCLFHKNFDHDVNFRPDLNYNCGESDTIETKSNHTTIYSKGIEHPEKSSVLKQGRFGRTLRGTTKQGPSNSTPTNTTKAHLRPTFRSTGALTDLEKFWTDSELLNTLDDDLVQTLSTALEPELVQIEQTRAHMNAEPNLHHAQDPNVLLTQVHIAMNRLSWSQRSTSHGV